MCRPFLMVKNLTLCMGCSTNELRFPASCLRRSFWFQNPTGWVLFPTFSVPFPFMLFHPLFLASHLLPLTWSVTSASALLLPLHMVGNPSVGLHPSCTGSSDPSSHPTLSCDPGRVRSALSRRPALLGTTTPTGRSPPTRAPTERWAWPV